MKESEMYQDNGYPIEGYRHYIVPLNIDAMMSGVVYSWQEHDGSIVLLYSDHTKESTPKAQKLISEFDNFSSIVSFVQEFRNINQ